MKRVIIWGMLLAVSNQVGCSGGPEKDTSDVKGSTGDRIPTIEEIKASIHQTYQQPEVVQKSALPSRPVVNPDIEDPNPSGSVSLAIDTHQDGLQLAGSEDVDLRSFDTSVKQQGRRLTCSSFAVVAVIENILRRKSGQSFDLSEEHLWSYYRVPSRIDALRNASRHLLTEEKNWPYNGRSLGGSVPGIAKLTSYQQTAPSVGSVHSSLKNGKPVVLSLPVNRSFYNPPASGVIDARSQGTSDRHLVAVTGVAFDDDIPGGGFFIIKNSWGRSYGNGGYAFLPFSYCQRFTCYAYLVDGIEVSDTISVNPDINDDQSIDPEPNPVTVTPPPVSGNFANLSSGIFAPTVNLGRCSQQLSKTALSLTLRFVNCDGIALVKLKCNLENSFCSGVSSSGITHSLKYLSETTYRWERPGMSEVFKLKNAQDPISDISVSEVGKLMTMTGKVFSPPANSGRCRQKLTKTHSNRLDLNFLNCTGIAKVELVCNADASLCKGVSSSGSSHTIKYSSGSSYSWIRGTLNVRFTAQ